MAILDFSKIIKKTSDNRTLNQDVSQSLKLKDLINFSTNDTTTQYETSTQWSPTTTNTSVWAPFLAFNSPFASSSPSTAASVTPTTTTEQAQKDSGGAGINANTIILGIVLIVGIYFGITYLTETDPTKNAAEVAKEVKK